MQRIDINNTLFKSSKEKTFSEKTKSSMAVFKLINKHFWKSKVGPISALAMPLFFMIVYKIIGAGRTDGVFENGLASYLSFCILPICLISLPQIMVDLKVSIILRKISTSQVTALKFCFILLGYYLLTTVASVCIVIILFASFLNKNAPQFFNSIDWGQMIYALINIMITSLTFGLFMGVMIKKNNMVQIIGIIVLLISCAFSGQLIPLQVLATSDAMRYIPLFSPLSYGLSMMNNVLVKNNEVEAIKLAIINPAFAPDFSLEELKKYVAMANGNSIFDMNHSFVYLKVRFTGTIENNDLKIVQITPITFYEIWQKGLNIAMPIAITIALLTTSILKFNWTSR